MKLPIKNWLMFSKYVICFAIGLLIGIWFIEIWDYGATQSKSALHQVAMESFGRKSLGDYLFNKTRVVCWIMTMPANHLRKAMHVRLTWGTRCNKLIFFSTESDKYLQTIPLEVSEGRENLWMKTREAFKYLYDNHLDDADWFMKADDDTYMIMENLRYFLYPFSPEAPVYFGCKFHPIIQKGYMSGGAGYILSRESLKRYGEWGYSNNAICPTNENDEDTQMGNCLQNLGVVGGDSRDETGRERFIPMMPQSVIPLMTVDWYTHYLYYKPTEDHDCCSSTAISFHYMEAKEFYMMEYYLYELQVIGYQKDNIHLELPRKANMTELLNKWRNEKSNQEP